MHSIIGFSVQQAHWTLDGDKRVVPFWEQVRAVGVFSKVQDPRLLVCDQRGPVGKIPSLPSVYDTTVVRDALPLQTHRHFLFRKSRGRQRSRVGYP